jgi:outer membrane protein assembly factor BamB
MATETVSAVNSSNRATTAPAKPLRLWPLVLAVAAFWAYDIGAGFLERTISVHFFGYVISVGVLFLAVVVWMFVNRGMRWSDRLLNLGVMTLGSFIVAKLCDPTVGVFGVVFMGLPIGLTIWTVLLLITRKNPAVVARWGLLASLAPVWIGNGMVRMQGIDGEMHGAMHWRWSPTSEQLAMVERKKQAADAKSIVPAPAPSDAQPSDWPGFRGAARDGRLSGVRIATDWSTAPPKLLWSGRVGPAWSSFAVVGDRLYTQEQRGPAEAVVCFDANTGHEIWSHEDEARFDDVPSGAGPRATPTFSAGRIYAQGATGILNCLDAATGKLRWTHDIAADSATDGKKTAVPMWGFSSSPLVVGDAVVVYAGGGDKGLLAYNADSGKLIWTAAAGKISYSSPQAMTFGGASQIVFFGDHGLTAVEPEHGAVRWTFDSPGGQAWRAITPRQLGDRILFGSEDLGAVAVDVKRTGDKWSATREWATKNFKPAYNDFVDLDGNVYGFDGSVFCCVDAATGQRRWKAGHYGHGQVLLIADQKLLLVLAESGEAVLVAANPTKLEELGRFQAVEGKTWNHPVVAQNRLFVRNDQQMACYQLTPETTKVGTLGDVDRR